MVSVSSAVFGDGKGVFGAQMWNQVENLMLAMLSRARGGGRILYHFATKCPADLPVIAV
jgi:hypothetical protein